VIASKYCRQYIKDNYTIGPLCGQIPTVNFKQEITTCVEDIQVYSFFVFVSLPDIILFLVMLTRLRYGQIVAQLICWLFILC